MEEKFQKLCNSLRAAETPDDRRRIIKELSEEEAQSLLQMFLDGVVDIQTRLMGIENGIEWFKEKRPVEDIQRMLIDLGVGPAEEIKRQVQNPRGIDWLKKQASKLFRELLDTVDICKGIIAKTPLGWSCSGVTVTVNVPFGAGVSFHFML